MGQIAIHVHGLSKRYRLGPTVRRHDTLAGALVDLISRPGANFRRLRRLTAFDGDGDHDPDTIWALRRVSFHVARGEVLGVIGHNGSGKSTLLKILSRITEPTEGVAKIRGRVGSLLEVGTGFHPELTGRHNVYLNGTILGMKKAEIDRHFDEIVAFAGVERFIDTPVKRYSSGMKVRLGFAVAAHLNTEILLVDEVLAVGDAAFQRKCLGKMDEVTREGRTVLFVSHDMAAVLSLCKRALLLESGRLVEHGATQEMVQRYVQSALGGTARLDERVQRSGDGSVRASSIRIESADAETVIRAGSRLRVTVGYRSGAPVRYARFRLSIWDSNHGGIFLLDSDAAGAIPDTLPPTGTVTCVTDPINLTPGLCYVNLAIRRGGVLADAVGYAASFDVGADDFHGSGKLPRRERTLCLLRHRWSSERVESYSQLD